jgi:DNA-binding SARP family transcriptional activator/tetratricopeptide (TPR) repeat protein/TolB-like protein
VTSQITHGVTGTMAKTHLTVLGDVELRTHDGDLVGSVLNQPRRLALLVYLALESRGGGVQRDRLLGVFWPDLSQDQGRQALRTALHFLRRSLGTAALTGDGGAVGVDPDTIACDAVDFRALRQTDPAAALQLYRGDLLPGFYLDDGPPEFERWLEETRVSLRREAAEAAWSLAAEQEAAGNAPGAGAWARRAAQLCDGDEAAARRAIELLGRIGDRAGALATYQELARRLREDFGAEPSPASRAAVEQARLDRTAVADPGPEATVVGQTPGPDLVGAGAGRHPFPPTGGEPDQPAAVERPLPPSGWRGAVRRASRGMYSLAVTLLLMAGFYSLWGLSRGDAGPAVSSRMVSVLHVEDMRDFTGDGVATDLAGALTLEITGHLNGMKSLQVVPVASAGGAGRSAPPTYIVRGGLLRSDSVVRVTAMLLDGASGATLERITAERPLAGSTETTAELADILARGIRREVGRAVEDRERSATARNPRALSLVRAAIRDVETGDSLATSGAIDAAVLSFAAADSQLALAQVEAPRWSEPSIQRAELAYRRMWLHLAPPTVDIARAGQALHGGVSHAHTALAMADDPGALELRGLLNYWQWRLRSAGSEAENEAARSRAEADLLRATQMDAGRARAWSLLSALHGARGDFAAANLTARRAHQADPYLENANETILRLFTTSLEIGDPAAARYWCEELGRRTPSAWLATYCVLEQMAWYEPSAGTDEQRLRSIVDAAVHGSQGAGHARSRLEMLRAVILARVGSSAAALAAIQTAKDVGAREDTHLRVLEAWARLTLGDDVAAIGLLKQAAAADPRSTRPMLLSRRFEALRADGRFAELVPLED